MSAGLDGVTPVTFRLAGDWLFLRGRFNGKVLCGSVEVLSKKGRMCRGGVVEETPQRNTKPAHTVHQTPGMAEDRTVLLLCMTVARGGHGTLTFISAFRPLRQG